MTYMTTFENRNILRVSTFQGFFLNKKKSFFKDQVQ